MESAYQKLLEARQQLYQARLRGHANRPLSNAIGAVIRWLCDRPEYKDESLKTFLNRLTDPAFIYSIRNLGPRRIQLIFKYFKVKSPRSKRH